MTVAVTHKFVSGKGNGSDGTQVQPSNWNDTHSIQCAANSVLGNTTNSTGNVSEVPLGALGISLLAATTVADLIAAGVPIFSTGDVKLTIKTVADTGWIMCNDQTIGNVSSGATYANANAQSLFTLLWNNVSNTYAPVTGGRGANAAADWAAQKPIQLTAMMGRALGVGGSGSGLTSRTLGQTTGEENHLLVTNEIPAHKHTLTDPGHTHTYTGPGTAILNSGAGFPEVNGASNTGSAVTGITMANTGGGASHNNMQPTSFLNAMIKL
jgi:microcystin-dependent protein